jgi:hypothetical protein
MTTIFERAATAIATLSVPYANQVYIPQTGTALPDQFIVFFLVSSQPVLQADDAEELRGNRVQVSVYDRNGLVSLPDVDTAMIAAGFKRSAKNQLPFNQETRHFGLALEYTYLEDE